MIWFKLTYSTSAIKHMFIIPAAGSPTTTMLQLHLNYQQPLHSAVSWYLTDNTLFDRYTVKHTRPLAFET